MKCRSVKVPRARAVALAVSMGLLGSLAMAGPSLASAPTSGTACQASDGKVNGRGATFQTKAQTALINGYTADVCGPVASDADAGTNMIAYNYASAANNSLTGSGAGQKAASCRTDAFSGTDIPYDQATLTALNGAPGSLAGANCAGLPAGFTPPFAPTPGPWPDANDATTNVMSFPVAGSSVGLGIHLTAASCGGGAPPTTINLTKADVSGIFQGSITVWNDPLLVADNAGLSACSGAITRDVRLDSSGTTQTFKNYLKNADGVTTTCDGVNTWTVLAQNAHNQDWPTTGTCAANLARPATSGGGAVVTLVQGTEGGIGYADYADWIGKAGIVLARVQNAAGGAAPFPLPGSGNAASCTFSSTLPGTSIADAVGLSPSSLNWATDATPNKSDVTYQGTGYPICGYTWDFVYTGMHVLNGTTVGNPIARLSNDQRRTLYSYFTYVFSPAGQSRLTTAGYDVLPASWLTKLRQGFQSNF